MILGYGMVTLASHVTLPFSGKTSSYSRFQPLLSKVPVAIAVQSVVLQAEGRKVCKPFDNRQGARVNGSFWPTGLEILHQRGAYSSFKPGQLIRFLQVFFLHWIDNPEERQDVNGNLIFAGEHLSDEFRHTACQTGRLAAVTAIRRIQAQQRAEPRDNQIAVLYAVVSDEEKVRESEDVSAQNRV